MSPVRPTLRDGQQKFTGVNLTADPADLGPTEVLIAINVTWTAYGAATKRPGTQQLGAQPFGQVTPPPPPSTDQSEIYAVT
jgi:hypothetical protein